jgi:hypothetical protein
MAVPYTSKGFTDSADCMFNEVARSRGDDDDLKYKEYCSTKQYPIFYSDADECQAADA